MSRILLGLLFCACFQLQAAEFEIPYRDPIGASERL